MGMIWGSSTRRRRSAFHRIATPLEVFYWSIEIRVNAAIFLRQSQKGIFLLFEQILADEAGNERGF
jgi:hypothetical protein